MAPPPRFLACLSLSTSAYVSPDCLSLSTHTHSHIVTHTHTHTLILTALHSGLSRLSLSLNTRLGCEGT